MCLCCLLLCLRWRRDPILWHVNPGKQLVPHFLPLCHICVKMNLPGAGNTSYSIIMSWLVMMHLCSKWVQDIMLVMVFTIYFSQYILFSSECTRHLLYNTTHHQVTQKSQVYNLDFNIIYKASTANFPINNLILFDPNKLRNLFCLHSILPEQHLLVWTFYEVTFKRWSQIWTIN